MSIVLPEDEHQALCDLALREWREPREQAGFMIVEGLRAAGVIHDGKNVIPCRCAKHPVSEAT